MLFLAVAVILLALKLAAVGPFEAMSWWWVLGFLGAAALWWYIADTTGMTQRRAMDRMEEKKLKRRERDMEALGLNTRRAKRLQAIKDAKRRSMTPEERQAVSPDAHESGRK